MEGYERNRTMHLGIVGVIVILVATIVTTIISLFSIPFAHHKKEKAE